MRSILLQTTPHSGTHTAMYIFEYLGGIPTHWHHWNASHLRAIEMLAKLDLRDMVVVHTQRPLPEITDSYKRRSGGKDDSLYLIEEASAIATKYRRSFPVPWLLPITDEANTLRDEIVMCIFDECDTPMPDSVERYMDTWEPLNASENPYRGSVKRGEHSAVKALMVKRRITLEGQFK